MARPQRRSAPVPPPQKSLLPQAVAAFQQGRPDDCAALCERILAAHGGHADALHLLGVSRLQLGDAAGAVQVLRRAARSDANNAELHTNLGAALRVAGEREEARTTLECALALKPDHVPALINLANVASDANDHGEAATQCRRALALSPGHPGALANLGRALAAAGDSAAAEEAYRGALGAAPGHPDALRGLARLYRETRRWRESLAAYGAALSALPPEAALHNERGVVLLALDQPEAAAAAFRAALAVDPGCADARINLGSALCLAGQAEDGAAMLEAALEGGLKDADTLSNLGAALSDAGLRDRAAQVLAQALAQDANHADALHNLAGICQEEGRPAEAVALYDRALASAPDHVGARYGRATANLAAGHFAQGWADYLLRPSMVAVQGFRRIPLPEELEGCHVLVERDQGLGDEIFFLRFVPALQARGARVTYRPDPRLAAMLRRGAPPDRVLDNDEAPDTADWYVSVGDLPFLLGYADDDALPPSIALAPLPERVEALRARLESFAPRPWVGLTWSAGTRNRRKALSKEVPGCGLARALAGTYGGAATWFALQRLPAAGEVDSVSGALGATVHDLTALNDDVEDMLALVSLLDDYICVSNTNVHLRAACGRACRVLVPHPPEFRWMTADGPSPWFPNMPTYRQRPDGGWGDAFTQLAADLAAR